MDAAAWKQAVKDNVQERLQGSFDWQRIQEAVWTAGYVADLPPEQMGLVVVCAMAVSQCLAQSHGETPPTPSVASRVVEGTARMVGASAMGKK